MGTTMKHFHFALVLTLCLSMPLMAQSDVEGEAEAVFATFLEAMTNGDDETLASLFAEDALFWGTGSQSLVTTPAGVQAYFEPVGRFSPGANVAGALDVKIRALGSDMVMVSGMWDILPQGQTTAMPMRVSMLLALRNGEWKIIQFHNSTVPG